MAVHRIRGDILDSWALYPVFERRVLEFAKQLGTPLNFNLVATELRQRFVNAPLFSGYWLFAEDGKDVGHICSWLTTNVGVLEIFFWQHAGSFSLEHRRELFTQVGTWIDEIDEYQRRLNVPQPGVVACSFVTARHGDAYGEYLERMGFEKPQQLTLLKFRRKPLSIRQSEASTITIPKALVN